MNLRPQIVNIIVYGKNYVQYEIEQESTMMGLVDRMMK